MLLGNLKGEKGDRGDRGERGDKGDKGKDNDSNKIASVQLILHHPMMSASAPATNLSANTIGAVSDPNLRQFADLREVTKCRIHGRLGGSVSTSTKVRLQYHLGDDITVPTNDNGWKTLADSSGNHSVNTIFRSAEVAVPLAAKVQNCLVRAVLFSGDGQADPTITSCIVDFIP